jgi:ribosomal protein S18 acetylase RimI-like enzyme
MNHEAITIRPAEEADWGALKAIRLASLRDAPTAFGLTYESAAAYSDEQWTERAAARTRAGYLLAVRNDEAVGLVGDYVNEAGQYNLIAMWVRPDFRSSGIAGRLVDAVKARAIAKGHVRVVLDVSPDNLRAANFYRKQGFAFIPEWEPLASHPDIKVQKMEWLATA